MNGAPRRALGALRRWLRKTLHARSAKNREAHLYADDVNPEARAVLASATLPAFARSSAPSDAETAPRSCEADGNMLLSWNPAKVLPHVPYMSTLMRQDGVGQLEGSDGLSVDGGALLSAVWRTQVLDWLIVVCRRHRLCMTTLFAVAPLVDGAFAAASRVERHPLSQTMVQLVALACLRIASKLHDKEVDAFGAYSAVRECGRECTVEDVMDMEHYVCAQTPLSLLCAPTAFTYVNAYVHMLSLGTVCATCAESLGNPSDTNGGHDGSGCSGSPYETVMEETPLCERPYCQSRRGVQAEHARCPGDIHVLHHALWMAATLYAATAVPCAALKQFPPSMVAAAAVTLARGVMFGVNISGKHVEALMTQSDSTGFDNPVAAESCVKCFQQLHHAVTCASRAFCVQIGANGMSSSRSQDVDSDRGNRPAQTLGGVGCVAMPGTLRLWSEFSRSRKGRVALQPVPPLTALTRRVPGVWGGDTDPE